MAATEAIMIGNHPLTGTLQGASYKVTRLGGWWERPNVKRNVLPRELSDGDFPSPWHFEARYISIDGLVEAESHAQAHHIMDQLNGLAVTRREYLTVQGHGVTQSALVEADGGALVETITDKLVRFELRFKANDPRKYGELRIADVGHNWSTLRQLGNYPAVPSFRLLVNGVGETGFQLSGEYPDGHRRVWWYFYPGDNLWNEIDFATGRHLTVGVNRPQRIRYSETFDVPPHEHVRVRARPHSYDDAYGPGSVEGTASWRDTWI